MRPNARYEYVDGVSYPRSSLAHSGEYGAVPWSGRPTTTLAQSGDRLYPRSLSALSYETEENLNSLRQSLISLDPRYRLDMKHWHLDQARRVAGKALPRSHSVSGLDDLTNRTSVLFTNSALIGRSGWKRSTSDEDLSLTGNSEPLSTCYLCTTLSEHDRHMVRIGQRLKPKKPVKPRVKYVAPRPRRASGSSEEESDDERNQVVYRLRVTTGRKPGASTDAKVSVLLRGTHGKTKKKVLTRNHATKFSFGMNTTETFNVKARDVGRLTHLVIEHDGMDRKQGWFLEEVEVTSGSMRDVTLFPCHAWLSLHEGERRTKLVLKPSERSRNRKRRESSSEREIDYEVRVYTGNVSMAGTDANVFITLHGQAGTSSKLNLTSKSRARLFEKGKEDVFHLRLPDLGPLDSMRVEHDNTGSGPGWLLDKIVVISGGELYTFPCGQWLSVDEGDRKISRVLYEQGSARHKKHEMAEYKIQTFTGTVRGAGTDANVFVTLEGKRGATDKLPLRNKTRNNFENGNEDSFYVTAPDVGDVTRIVIEHDNSGSGPGWFLDKVIVTNVTSKHRMEFPCGRWLARDEDDGQVSRVLQASTADRARSKSPRSERTKPYEVRVQTGDKLHAGTDARVSVALLGTLSIGARHQLSSTAKSFERAQEDVFSIEAENVGELTGLRIEHDNSGRGPGWYLEKVTVTDMQSGKRYVFPCSQWLATDEGDGKISRTLSVEKKASTYGTSSERRYSGYELSQLDPRYDVDPIRPSSRGSERYGTSTYKSTSPSQYERDLLYQKHADHGPPSLYSSSQPDGRYGESTYPSQSRRTSTNQMEIPPYSSARTGRKTPDADYNPYKQSSSKSYPDSADVVTYKSSQDDYRSRDLHDPLHRSTSRLSEKGYADGTDIPMYRSSSRLDKNNYVEERSLSPRDKYSRSYGGGLDSSPPRTSQPQSRYAADTSGYSSTAAPPRYTPPLRDGGYAARPTTASRSRYDQDDYTTKGRDVIQPEKYHGGGTERRRMSGYEDELSSSSYRLGTTRDSNSTLPGPPVTPRSTKSSSLYPDRTDMFQASSYKRS